MNKTYIVSIGRNVQQNPLPAIEWDRFKHATIGVIEDEPVQVHFSGEGYGIYEGGHEDSFTVIFSVLADAICIARVKAQLAILAAYYSQESIAFTEGDTEFIAAGEELFHK